MRLSVGLATPEGQLGPVQPEPGVPVKLPVGLATPEGQLGPVQPEPGVLEAPEPGALGAPGQPGPEHPGALETTGQPGPEQPGLDVAAVGLVRVSRVLPPGTVMVL